MRTPNRRLRQKGFSGFTILIISCLFILAFSHYTFSQDARYTQGSWKDTFKKIKKDIFASEQKNPIQPKRKKIEIKPVVEEFKPSNLTILSKEKAVSTNIEDNTPSNTGLPTFDPMKEIKKKWKKIDAPAADSPLSLYDALKIALNNNYTYRAQQEDFKIARENVGYALTYTSPRVKFRNTQTFLDNPVSLGGVTIGDDSINISSFIVEQALITFGKANSGYRLALGDKRMKANDLKLKRQDIILDTIQAYTGYLKAKAAVKLSEESVNVIQKYLELVKNQFKAGVVLETDVLSTRVRLLEMKQKLIEAQNGKAIALENLCNIMVVPVKNHIMTIEVPDISGFKMDEQKCQKLIGSVLPEVETLRILEQINREQLHLEKVKRNPDIVMQSSWATGTQYSEKDSNWNANLVFEYNLIDSGEANFNIRKAQYTLNRTRHQLADLKQKMNFLVNTKKYQANQLGEQMEVAAELIKTSKKNTQQVRYQYINGTTLNTDVLEAELALSQARFQYINARYDYISTQAEIYRNIGMIEDFVSSINKDSSKYADSIKKTLMY